MKNKQNTFGFCRFFVLKFRDRARPADQKIVKTPQAFDISSSSIFVLKIILTIIKINALSTKIFTQTLILIATVKAIKSDDV